MRAAPDTVAAGWPLATCLALELVRDRVRDGRRRRDLRRAVHELRRSLQALALGAPAGEGTGSQLELARTALADLEAVVWGEPPSPRPRPVAGRPLLQAAIERWRRIVADPIELRWNAGAATLVAVPERISQAVDNLIAKAVEEKVSRALLPTWSTKIALTKVKPPGSMRPPREPAILDDGV